ncbi:MAG: periplasmic heavy metal sensor [Deltaproteobacteria bacterium]|nr:periplasmic heavy metal sensor [Deltaproteobacteria bacterium]
MYDIDDWSAERPIGRRRRLFRGVAVFASMLLVSGFLAGCARHAKDHHARYRHHRELSQDEIRERLGRGATRALDKVNATGEQRARIDAILDGLAPDLAKLQGERRAIRDRFVKALEADKVDPGEVAQVRAAANDLVDRVSARIMDAVVKGSEVLTPEQRRELVAKWREHHKK